MRKTQVHSVLAATLVALSFVGQTSISVKAQSSRENLVFIGQVRNDKGYLFRVEGATATSLGTATWDTCPQGTTLLGHDKQSNGFWLCASPKIARGTWYFGNVVKDTGYYWEIAGGNAKAVGTNTWDTCWEGSLRAWSHTSNGFWVCQP